MSILKSNITGVRIALLAQQDEKLFHISDLANLWNVANAHTLRMTIMRYCRNGLLYRIYKGFYSLLPLEKLDPVLLGVKAIHKYCYLTTEAILFQEGYIFQGIDYYTFVSEKSRNFQIGKNNFKSRQLSPRFLYNPEGIVLKNGYNAATLERAVADILYFNPKYHFDRHIDWKKVKTIQKKIGYPLTYSRYVVTKS